MGAVELHQLLRVLLHAVGLVVVNQPLLAHDICRRRCPFHIAGINLRLVKPGVGLGRTIEAFAGGFEAQGVGGFAPELHGVTLDDGFCVGRKRLVRQEFLGLVAQGFLPPGRPGVGVGPRGKLALVSGEMFVERGLRANDCRVVVRLGFLGEDVAEHVAGLAHSTGQRTHSLRGAVERALANALFAEHVGGLAEIRAPPGGFAGGHGYALGRVGDRSDGDA